MEDYSRELGARLRAIRAQQGLSLHAVEARSAGRWKAVVVGSYERGDRAVTVAKLVELAAFYAVPVDQLLPRGSDGAAEPVEAKAGHVVIDLRALSAAPAEDAAPVVRYTARIQAQRGDYNGRLLSLRENDLWALGALYGQTAGGVVALLSGWGALAGT